MRKKVVCPLCGKSFGGLVGKYWAYRDYDAPSYRCKHCKRRFMLGQKPDNSHTIPVSSLVRD